MTNQPSEHVSQELRAELVRLDVAIARLMLQREVTQRAFNALRRAEPRRAVQQRARDGESLERGR